MRIQLHGSLAFAGTIAPPAGSAFKDFHLSDRDAPERLISDGHLVTLPPTSRRGLALPNLARHWRSFSEVRAWYARLGAEIGSGPPEQLDLEIRNEYEKWSRVVREIGLRAMD